MVEDIIMRKNRNEPLRLPIKDVRLDWILNLLKTRLMRWSAA